MKNPKTIAQYAIIKYLEEKIGIRGLEVRFTDAKEALITDENGDHITLKYDSDTQNVYAI